MSTKRNIICLRVQARRFVDDKGQAVSSRDVVALDLNPIVSSILFHPQQSTAPPAPTHTMKLSGLVTLAVGLTMPDRRPVHRHFRLPRRRQYRRRVVCVQYPGHQWGDGRDVRTGPGHQLGGVCRCLYRGPRHYIDDCLWGVGGRFHTVPAGRAVDRHPVLSTIKSGIKDAGWREGDVELRVLRRKWTLRRVFILWCTCVLFNR